jgi:hypothetical protein
MVLVDWREAALVVVELAFRITGSTNGTLARPLESSHETAGPCDGTKHHVT